MATGVFAPSGRASAFSLCAGFSVGDRFVVEDSAVIVIGSVGAGSTETAAIIEPEAYLKGSAEFRPFVLKRSELADLFTAECPAAVLEEGGRFLLVLYSNPDSLAWPTQPFVFHLRNGMAVNETEPPLILPEDELIREIRSITGQYVVPAEGEGTFSIQGSNILILVVALVVVFGIGLALMRVWHRIDPT